jgi:hypothetical protein
MDNFIRKSRNKLDRFLSGSAPSDPLYLSNRTTDQVVKKWLLIGVPLLVVVVAVVFGFRRFHPAERPAEPEAPTAQSIAKMLPDSVKHEMKLETNKDLDVVEVHVDRALSKLIGSIRNTTSHEIRSGEVIFNITAADKTQLGAVSVPVSNLAAGGTAAFQVALTEPTAALAIVREARSQ